MRGTPCTPSITSYCCFTSVFLPKPIPLLNCQHVNFTCLQDPIRPALAPESLWFLAHSWQGWCLHYEASSLFRDCQEPNILASQHRICTLGCHPSEEASTAPFIWRRDGGKQIMYLTCTCALVWLFCHSVWLILSCPDLQVHYSTNKFHKSHLKYVGAFIPTLCNWKLRYGESVAF